MSFVPDISNLWIAKAVALRDRFAEDAIERDRRGGRPVEQIRLLKEAGLLTIVIPKALGGAGEPYSTALRITREFAKVDGSLGHIYGYHFSALIGAILSPGDAQAESLLRRSAEGHWFWGNTGNSFSKTLFGHADGDWTIVNGFKPFASGSHVADYVTTSWEDDATHARIFASIPADREGITIHDDWDGFGQTQTGSGRVSYTDVRIHESEVIKGRGDLARPIGSLGALQQQSVLLNVFIGSAQGALLAARDEVVAQGDVPESARRRLGELWVKTEAATALADRALGSIDSAISRSEALTAEERGLAAIAIASANVLTGNVALEVTEQVLEIIGPVAAERARGFDRFWRNVRIHTLHNPAEYKTLTVGKWFLTGDFPDPAIFQ